MPNKESDLTRSSRYLLGNDSFQFACHSGVTCYTRCCHNADMYLYPYDIIRLKQRLGMTSEEFLMQHTITALRDMPSFPNVMLKMSDKQGHPCTFLSETGCSVYEDRPFSCRAYPLEPAMYGDETGQIHSQYYVARHKHCLGHRETAQWSALSWMEDQQMNEYTPFNARWAGIAARFKDNPFGPQGVESPASKMAFMAAYNIDTFRRFVFESSFLTRFDLPEERLEDVRRDDTALLLLGLDWILSFLFGEERLPKK